MRRLSALLSAARLASIPVAALSWEQASRFEFGPPINLGSVINSPAFDGGPSISGDGLALFLTSERPGGAGGGDIWVARRARLTDPFGAPENLGTGVNTPANEFAPSISADGLALYFDSDRPGGLGAFDIWVATRASVAEPFGVAQNLGPSVNSASSDGLPSISADGRSLYFASRRTGGVGEMDLWVARRETAAKPFARAEHLGRTLNSPQYDGEPSISADGLNLFLASDRPGTRGQRDLWVASRSNLSSAFGRPRNLGPPVNTSSQEVRPSISVDGSTLFFMSDRPGGSGHIDLWQAPNRARPTRRR
jgi:Tol biopolymer transport system component